MGYLVAFYFMALDFFTGLLRAFATDTFASRMMRRGLFHKVSLLCVLVLGWLMDYAQGYVDLGVSVPVGAAACVYIVLMECGSILENLCQTNPELMPDRLCKVFGVTPPGALGAAPLGEGGGRTGSPSPPALRGDGAESGPEQTDVHKLNRRE